MILILSQTSRLLCDLAAAVLKSTKYSHAASSLKTFREATVAAWPFDPLSSPSVGKEPLIHIHH